MSYICELCEGEEPFTVPADEIGAAVMQQHLESEHGRVVTLTLFRDCQECGHAVLCRLDKDQPPQRCSEHT